jgi:hypothetical protein
MTMGPALFACTRQVTGSSDLATSKWCGGALFPKPRFCSIILASDPDEPTHVNARRYLGLRLRRTSMSLKETSPSQEVLDVTRLVRPSSRTPVLPHKRSPSNRGDGLPFPVQTTMPRSCSTAPSQLGACVIAIRERAQ